MDALPGAAAPITGTVLVPLYNHAAFVRDRLESLFGQWQPGLELLLIDDASTDNGFAVALDVLARHPEIPATVARNAERQGMGTLATALGLARGAVLIQADSDDTALPGRLRAVMDCFAADPACRLVTTNAVLLSAEGRPVGLLDPLQPDQVFTDPRQAASRDGSAQWLGTTAAYHRDVFDRFPPLDPQLCPYGLDLLVPFRAVLIGSHHYLSRPLVGWRQHGRNAHRVAGVGSDNPDAAEAYQAMEMMVLAQRLRDAEHLAARSPRAEAPAAPQAATRAEVVELCQMQFFRKFERWCRLRSRQLSQRLVPSGSQAGPPAPARQPPVATLRAGERFDCRKGQFGGTVMECWPGFYAAESWASWTQHLALIGFRIGTPRASRLRICLAGLSYVERQRVGLSVADGAWTDVALRRNDAQVVELPIGDEPLLTLMIHAHHAAKPPTPDDRVLGVALLWIEIAPGPPVQ